MDPQLSGTRCSVGGGGVALLRLRRVALLRQGDSAEKTRLLEMCNTLFTTLFMGEAALRIHGLGWAGYWADGWNK
eukprot:784043-Prymnesium_polylepis.1